MSRSAILAAACAGVLATSGLATGQVVINEFQYDDGGTDDREFVELHNTGASPVDIGNWTLGGRDPTTTNTSVTILAGTTLNPGQYFVVGMTGTLNVNQTNATFLENDNETIELRDAGTVLIDAVAYETNKGVAFASDVSGQVGPGVFGNANGPDVGTTAPLNVTYTFGRYVDGRDTDNNGRDFGMRPSTPGASNNTGLMTFYTPPNPTGQTVGGPVPGLTGSFVGARFIDPTVGDTNNPNAVAPAPTTGNRAIVAWDPSGGGNGVTSNQVFGTRQGGFNIFAYLDTSDQPQNTNTAGTPFTGSEVTLYGIGGGDGMGVGVRAQTDLTGAVGLAATTPPQSESENGFTGLAWAYEKTAITGATPATQRLHLVDANDGGDSHVGGGTPLDWTILTTIDLGNMESGWYDLGIAIDPAGNGVANFNGQTFAFTASPALHSGAFNIGYRENLQLGADTTPDALMRPPTFTLVPEPGSLALLGLTGLLGLRRRRRR